MKVYTIEHQSAPIGQLIFADRRDAEEIAASVTKDFPDQDPHEVRETEVRPRPKRPEDWLYEVEYGYNGKRAGGVFDQKGYNIEALERLMVHCVSHLFCDWFLVTMRLTSQGPREMEEYFEIPWNPEQREAIEEVLAARA
jgi:hypothetical protein